MEKNNPSYGQNDQLVHWIGPNDQLVHWMDKTTNWCISEAGSLWPIIISVVRFWFSVSVSSDSWASY